MLLDHITQAAVIRPVMETPVGVEARKRVNTKGEEIFIVINHEREERQVYLPWSGCEHLTGQRVSELKLEPYGVAVITHSV